MDRIEISNEDNYPKWIDLIHMVEDTRYYENLFIYAKQILEDNNKNSNSDMCIKLRLNPQQYTTIKKLLQVYVAQVIPNLCILECDERSVKLYRGVGYVNSDR